MARILNNIYKGIVFFNIYLFYLFIFLAASGLSCGNAGSFVAACGLGLLSSCGVWVFSL